MNSPALDEGSGGMTPLQAAHMTGDQTIAEALVRNGADAGTISVSTGPLHVAATWAVRSKVLLLNCNCIKCSAESKIICPCLR